MKDVKGIWTGIAIATALMVVALVSILLTTRPEPGPPAPLATPASEPIKFTDHAHAAPILRAVERVSRPGHSRVAVQRANGGEWVCILVDGPEPYCDLDAGLARSDLPGLAERGFREPPPPIRRQMSIYRSLAAKAIDYDRVRGDRIIVLFCPQADWPALRLHWPPPTPHTH